jgi:hypothetical protein
MVLRDEKGRKMVAGKWWQENGGRKMVAGKWWQKNERGRKMGRADTIPNPKRSTRWRFVLVLCFVNGCFRYVS